MSAAWSKAGGRQVAEGGEGAGANSDPNSSRCSLEELEEPREWRLAGMGV